jgi:hypothetical protein
VAVFHESIAFHFKPGGAPAALTTLVEHHEHHPVADSNWGALKVDSSLVDIYNSSHPLVAQGQPSWGRAMSEYGMNIGATDSCEVDSNVDLAD